jgi:hypothetical protein
MPEKFGVIFCPAVGRYYTGNGTFDATELRWASRYADYETARRGAQILNDQGYCNSQCRALEGWIEWHMAVKEDEITKIKHMEPEEKVEESRKAAP